MYSVGGKNKDTFYVMEARKEREKRKKRKKRKKMRMMFWNVRNAMFKGKAMPLLTRGQKIAIKKQKQICQWSTIPTLSEIEEKKNRMIDRKFRRKKTQEAKSLKKMNREKKTRIRQNTQVVTSQDEEEQSTHDDTGLATRDVLMIIITSILNAPWNASKYEVTQIMRNTIQIVSALLLTCRCFNEVIDNGFLQDIYRSMYCVKMGCERNLKVLFQILDTSNSVTITKNTVVFNIHNDSDEDIIVFHAISGANDFVFIPKGRIKRYTVRTLNNPDFNHVRHLRIIPTSIGQTEYTWDRVVTLTCDKKDLSGMTCPLSLDVINVPAFTSDGEIYEAIYINRWLDDHDTSPMTNIKLEDKSVTSGILCEKVTFKGFNNSKTPPKKYEKIDMVQTIKRSHLLQLLR